MRYEKDIDLKISIGICLLGIFLTCYLWPFVNGGNHWELFGTKTEKFLMKYGELLILIFSGSLVIPLIFKRDKKRLIIGLFSIPVFIFLARSLVTFLD